MSAPEQMDLPGALAESPEEAARADEAHRAWLLSLAEKWEHQSTDEERDAKSRASLRAFAHVLRCRLGRAAGERP